MQIITKHLRNALAIALLIMTVAATGATAATFTINQTGDAGDLTCDATCTLRDAIDDSNNTAGADTIVFSSLFNSAQMITLASVISLNPAPGDSLTITGPGQNLLTVSGNNAVRIFNLDSGDTAFLSGMTLRQAVTGAIGNAGNLTVTNMTFDANTSNGLFSDSGAIGNRQALSLTVTGCTFTNNINTFLGGAAITFNSFNANPTATITNSTFTNNSGTNGINSPGGAIHHLVGSMTITGSTFNGNVAGGDGGAIAVQGGGQLTINSSVLTGNSSPERGGAIYYQPNGGTPFLNINNSTISNNTANSDSNTTGNGGGLYLTGEGSVTITGSTINGNTANMGSNGTGFGGGIYNEVSTTLTNSTVSGNTAGRNGGGIYAIGVTTTILNITNSTIVSNTATLNGGGIERASATNPVNFRNSIFANNIASGGTSPDVLGTVNSNGFNLIENTTGATIGGTTATNITGQDPNLGPLQNNGGMTFTHALIAGSPAIDKGESSGTTSDQRMQTRPVDNPSIPNAAGDGADIGAFEVQPVLQFSAATYSVNENGGTATITVTRTDGSEGVDSVQYSTANGTATGGANCGAAGVDYQTATGVVTFAVGETSQTFTITICDDASFEGSETINLTLSLPIGATIGTPNTAVLTIIDNETAQPGTVQFSAATYSVGEAGPTATITVTRAGGSDGAISVQYGTTNNSATGGATCAAGVDFINTSGTFNFAAGNISPQSFTVPICEDTEVEGSQTFNVVLSNPTGGATLGTPNSALVTIVDNDTAQPGVLALSSATYSGSEGLGTLTVTVNRTGGTDGAVGATYALTNGTATGGATCAAGVDFVNTGGTVSFANGTATQTFTVAICNDAVFESDETFNVTLSNPQGGATLGTPTTAVVTIINDDAAQPGTLQFNPAAYTVGEAGGTVTLTVTRTGGTDGAVAASYTLANSTATGGGTCAANVDFINTGGTVSFINGQASQTITVTICNDAVLESSEAFTATIASPTGGAIIGSPATATVTINDDETAQPGALQFSAVAYTVGEAGPTAIITVTRTGGSDGIVTADYATVAGGTAMGGASCAMAGVDYVTTTGTVTFGSGVTTPQTFTIPICNDVMTEPSETVNLALSNATGGAAVGSPNMAVLTINDNDAAGVTVTPTTVSVTEGGATATYSVVLNTQPTANVVITIMSGSQVTVNPTTLTFTAANFNISQTVTVTAVDDAVIEGNHTGTITQTAMSGDANYNGVAVASVTANITDNDSDMVAPVITYTPIPSEAAASNPTLSVTITDAVGVTSASIFFKINNSAVYTSNACTLSSGSAQNGVWNCPITGTASGQAISYYVTAADAAGNVGANPAGGAATPNLYTIGTATVPGGTYTNLNSGSATLGGNVTVVNNLTLNGIVNNGAFTLMLSQNTSITRISGYIIGNVTKQFVAQSIADGEATAGLIENDGALPIFIYPVGTANGYSPVSATITSSVAGSSLSVFAKQGTQPNLNSATTLQRYWTLLETGTLTADLTFTYLTDAIDVRGNEAMYQVIRVTGGIPAFYIPSSVDTVNNMFTATNVSDFSDWTAGTSLLAPSAAPAEISGRVLNTRGRGLENATVTLSGGTLTEPISVSTNSSGRYRFADIPSGETYILTVTAKGYTFSQPTTVFTVIGNLENVNFVGEGR